jgi:starch-binding outer membrane protein SusE/F
MKTVFNKFFAGMAAMLAVVLLMLAGCKKDLQTATLAPGSLTGLSASSSTLVLDSSGGGTKNAVTLSWPAVNYGAKVAVTYTLQIDSMKGDFSKAVSINLASGLAKSYSEADFNTLALSLGLVPAAAGQLQVRVKADVNQSTGAASSVSTTVSNVLNLSVTP